MGRAAALLAALVWQLSGSAWLPLAFPTAGLLFAISGALMAASFDTSAEIGPVLARRLRRLLPPLWVLGLVAIPLMFAAGWTNQEDGSQPPDLHLLSWIIPLTPPPASDLGVTPTAPLWFLSTQLWLLFVSPALLWLWRHWPRTFVLLPLVILFLMTESVLTFPGVFTEGITSVLTFAACWMLGFSYHDGQLHGRPLPQVIVVGLLAMAAGVTQAISAHAWKDGLPAVADEPMARALFEWGFTAILLRLPGYAGFLRRTPVLRGLLTFVNHRALTIYLWTAPAVFAASRLVELPEAADLLGDSFTVGLVGATLVGLAVAAVAFGWIEDLAAGRGARLLPSGSASSGRAADPRRAIGP